MILSLVPTEPKKPKSNLSLEQREYVIRELQETIRALEDDKLDDVLICTYSRQADEFSTTISSASTMFLPYVAAQATKHYSNEI